MTGTAAGAAAAYWLGAVAIGVGEMLAARYGIRSIPPLLVFKGGQVVGQVVGAVPRAKLEAELKKHI